MFARALTRPASASQPRDSAPSPWSASAPVAAEQRMVPSPAAGHDFGRIAVRADGPRPIQRAGKKTVPGLAGKAAGKAAKAAAKAALSKTKTQTLNKQADSLSDDDVKAGALLAARGQKVYDKWVAKAEKRQQAKFNASRKAIEDAPSTYKGSAPLLSAETEWHRMHALATAEPQAYNLNLGGVKVELDAAPAKRKGRHDGDVRTKSKPHLPTTFLDTGPNKSYDAMVKDPKTNPATQTGGEKLLPHLEVHRNPRAAFNVFTKEALYHGGIMTAAERFADDGPHTFMEMPGATRPTRRKERVQNASSKAVMETIRKHHAGKKTVDPTFTSLPIGAPVNGRPTADSKELLEGSDDFLANPKTKLNKARLARQMARIFRSATGIDQGSESEMDTDDEK